MESVDFINKLIQRHPKNRLGNKDGIAEIKDHPWLRKYPWKKLITKELKSPFLPQNIPL
jgi:serine/threonine protein kinase